MIQTTILLCGSSTDGGSDDGGTTGSGETVDQMEISYLQMTLTMTHSVVIIPKGMRT